MDTLPHIKFPATDDMRDKVEYSLPRSFRMHYSRLADWIANGIYHSRWEYDHEALPHTILVECAVGTEQLVFGVIDPATGNTDYDFDSLLDAVIEGRFNAECARIPR